MFLVSRLPRRYRVALKSRLHQGQRLFVDTFRSYGVPDLRACLRSVGVTEGDTVMLHSGFSRTSGFRGSAGDLTDLIIDMLGPRGNLAMVSLPYRSSSIEYLENLEVFDVRRTPSMMGLVSEFYRRRPDVLRSLHPTHPVLASGPRAEWIVADHESCVHPCGPGTPFEKLLALDAKAVFFNVPFGNFTFFHNLEHQVHAELPFALYTDAPFEVPVIDRFGQHRTVTTYAFAREAIGRRRFSLFEREMRQRSMIRRARVGNSYVLMARLRDAVDCVRDMSRSGRYFYEFDGVADRSARRPKDGRDEPR